MQLTESRQPGSVFDSAQRRTFGAAWASTFLINIAWGNIFPLLNVYIHDRGVSLVLIGTLSTAGSVMFSVAGVGVGRLSDRLGNRRDLAVVMLMLGAASMAGYLWAQHFGEFLILSLVSMTMIGGYTVLIDAVITSVLPPNQRGGYFGAYRVSGSIGWALAGALLGVVTTTYGVQSIFVIALFAQLVAAVVALGMQEPRPAVRTDTSQEAPAPGVWSTLVNTGLLWLMIADLVVVFGAQLAYPFQNIYFSERLGATDGDLGWLSTIGVLAEIPAMIWLGTLSDRWGRSIILAVGFAAVSLSWLMVYLAPALWLIYVTRPLVGIGIVRYSVSVALISDRVPYERRATLLGLSNFTYGAGGLIAPSIGGLLAQNLGFQPVFLVGFAICLTGTVVYLVTMHLTG